MLFGFWLFCLGSSVFVYFVYALWFLAILFMLFGFWLFCLGSSVFGYFV